MALGVQKTVNSKITHLHRTVSGVTFTNNNSQSTPAALAQSDINQFVEMSPNRLVVLSHEGKILRFNRHFSNDFSAQSGSDFTSLFHTKDASRIDKVLKRASKPSSNKIVLLNHHSCESCMFSKNGSVKWMRWEISPSKDGQTLHAIGRDITPIKIQEQTIVRKQTELCEAESIARMGRWRWEIGSQSMSWSPELYNIFGKSDKEFRPSIDSLCGIIEQHDSDRLMQIFQRAMIERTSYEINMHIGEKGSKEEKIIRCEGRCELDSEGDVIALYGIMQDITAQILTERNLKNAKDQAERACSAKTQFLANMSHELRTPLNAIIGFSEIIKSQLLGPFGHEKYGDYINTIHTSGQHLLSLISDILDMARIQSGKYKLAHEEINITKIAGLCSHMMEGSAQEAGVSILVNGDVNFHNSQDTGMIEESDVCAVADRRAIMQIMLNVLSNSVKFTPNGGTVHINCANRDGGVEIEIKDTGVGIPSEHLHNIMMPFEQVENDYSRKHDGSGLGLAITKDLLELHGGRLSIESSINVGTNVIMWLPKGDCKTNSKSKCLESV